MATETPAVITVTQRFSRKALNYLRETPSLAHSAGTVALLETLHRNRKKGEMECTQTITYKVKPHNFGRYYGTKGSLEQLQSECRATLCAEYYHDVDIVNAQPVLLAQLAESVGFDAPQLDNYVANRDTVLAELMAEMHCSREDAKEAVLKVLYGGASECEGLASLRLELREFVKQLRTRAANAELWNVAEKKAKSEDKGVYGVFLSLVAQTMERECMVVMKTAFESRGWVVGVLAYDGVMVERRKGETITDTLLQEVQAEVELVTGYKVQVLEKTMTGFTVPVVDDRLSAAEGVTMEQYNDMKSLFERNHFYYEPTGQYVSVNEQTGKLLMMDSMHATDSLRTWFFQTGKTILDTTQFFPLWRKDPTRRTVSHIDMKPSTDPTVYSPPLRFAYNAAEAPDDAAAYVETFQDLVSKVIPDDVMRSLFLEWLANIVQRPFENSKTCIILAGAKGCGKDTIGDWISEYLLGRTLSQNYESNDQFWDKHDEARMNKLFVKLEEASGVLNKAHEDDFKGRITSETLTINPKGQRPVTSGNYVRYFLTTNSATPVALDEGERRFALIACGNTLVGKMDYWNALRGNGCTPKLFSKEAAKAVGDWLMTLPIGSFPRVLPRSELAQDAIYETTGSEARFVASDAWDGSRTSSLDLFHMYRQYCRDNELAGAMTATSFGLRMSQLVLEGKVVKRRGNVGFVYLRV